MKGEESLYSMVMLTVVVHLVPIHHTSEHA